MRFLHGKVKAKKCDTVKIGVSQPTRVLVMTKTQYKRYAKHRTFTYFGGQKDSTYDFSVPKDGVWHIIVEKGSFRNPKNIETTVIRELGQLPAASDKKKKKKKKKKELEAPEVTESMESNDEASAENTDETPREE